MLLKKNAVGNEIAGIIFNGNNRRANRAIVVPGSSNLHIHHARFIDIKQYSIMLVHRNRNVRIHDCRFHNASWGENHGTSGCITLTDFTNHWDGIEIYNCDFTSDMSPNGDRGGGSGCGIANGVGPSE